MSAVAPVNPKLQFGSTAANGSLDVYLAGTTTRSNTWQDKTQLTLNTNPIVLDSRGECDVWLDGDLTYKFVLKNAGGSTLWTSDNISGAAGAASLVNFLQAGTGTVARTAQDKMREIEISPNDFDDGSADTTVFERARDAAGVGGVVKVKGGTYTLNAFALNVANQTWLFDPNATINSSDAATVPAALITADGVKVRGGIWDNQAASSDAYAQVGCIKVNDADDVEIKDGAFKNARGPCIDANGTNRLKVKDNLFTNTWYAAVFVRPTTANIEDIEISGNRIINTTVFAGYDYGINAHNDSGSLYTITGVNIFGNTIRFPVIAASDFPLGIEVYGGPTGSAGDVVNVSVHGNNVYGGGIGISLSQVQDGTVNGNSVKDASRYGIEAVDPFGIAVSGNTVYGGQRGISLSQAGGGASVTGNSVRATTVAAVYASSVSERVAVTGNSISVTSGAGVYLLSTSYFSVVGNSLEGNGTGNKAVMLDKSDRGVVSGNTGSDWTENGILLFADTAVILNRVIGTNNIWVNTPNTLTLTTQLSGGASIGRFVSYIGNFSDVDTSYQRDVPDVFQNRVHVSGAGTPEGAITGGVGSIYERRDGGAATTLYIKESGTGNTGWVGK